MSKLWPRVQDTSLYGPVPMEVETSKGASLHMFMLMANVRMRVHHTFVWMLMSVRRGHSYP
jgi:hypothetical protein